VYLTIDELSKIHRFKIFEVFKDLYISRCSYYKYKGCDKSAKEL